MSSPLYYVTSNPGKFDEVRRYLAHHAPEINVQQYDIDIPEPQTLDQKAIALHKAQYAWNVLKQPVLIDDSGIYFDAYNQFPGTLTKYVFEGIGFDGIFALTEKNNRATFKLTLIYCHGQDQFEIFEGTCHGLIKDAPTREFPQGLPWDAIFYPEGAQMTYAQLRHDPAAMHYFYRIRAFDKFISWYNTTKKLED